PPKEWAMLNRSKVVAQIRVHHVTTPMFGEVEVHTSYGQLGVQPWAESVLLRRVIRLEDPSHHQMHGRLRHAIANTRDSQGPLAACAFGDPNTQEGLRSVLLRPQLRLEILE